MQGAEGGGPLARLLGGVRPGEGRLAFAAGLWFFCLMASYYCLRPLRDSFGSENPYELHWLFTGTFALTVVAQPLYGRLVARFGRRRFLPITYRALAANVIAFAVLFGVLEGEPLRWVQRVFFCWLSAFVLFGVSVFWSTLADLVGPSRAKRTYGLIALGGSLGAILGSALAGSSGWLTDVLGRLGEHGPIVVLPVLSALLLEAAVRAARVVERTPRAPDEDDPGSDDEEPVGGAALDGFREVARSPYLASIAAYVVVFVSASTMLYFITSVIAQDAFPGGDERTAFYGRVDTAVNVLTLLLQTFATGRVLRLLGLGVALAAVPLVGFLGFAGIALEPASVSVLVALYVARRASEFGLSKPARDALFTAVAREEKYKAKAVIDTVVYRGGDAAVLWIQTGLRARFDLGVAGLALLLVPVCAIGLLLSRSLGREHARRTAGEHEGKSTDRPAG